MRGDVWDAIGSNPRRWWRACMAREPGQCGPNEAARRRQIAAAQPPVCPHRHTNEPHHDRSLPSKLRRIESCGVSGRVRHRLRGVPPRSGPGRASSPAASVLPSRPGLHDTTRCLPPTPTHTAQGWSQPISCYGRLSGSSRIGPAPHNRSSKMRCSTLFSARRAGSSLRTLAITGHAAFPFAFLCSPKFLSYVTLPHNAVPGAQRPAIDAPSPRSASIARPLSRGASFVCN